MHWLCFLLANTAPAPAPAQARPLQFDVAALTARRDSYVFYLSGDERGAAVWQYEVRGPQLVFTATSELRPVEAESLHVVIDRATGAPLATFHRIERSHPRSDTTMVEHDLRFENGRVLGGRRVALRSGPVVTRAPRARLPAGAVLSDYAVLAAPVTNLAPGDSGTAAAYSEFGDSLLTLALVAEPVTSVTVPAGTFDVLPIRSSAFRVHVTRTAPRRVVKGESLDGVFRFELVRP